MDSRPASQGDAYGTLNAATLRAVRSGGGASRGTSDHRQRARVVICPAPGATQPTRREAAAALPPPSRALPSEVGAGGTAGPRPSAHRDAGTSPRRPDGPRACAAPCERRGTDGTALREGSSGTCRNSRLGSFARTVRALRCSPASFARFIGDLPNAARNPSSSSASRSRANVAASFPAMNSRGANGDPSRSSRANFTFHGHISLQVCRITRFAVRLTGDRGEVDRADRGGCP